jgi:replicative DNA helicase
MSDQNNPAKSFSNKTLKPIKNDSDLSTIMFGKVYPQALQLEEVVLGGIMLDKNAFTNVVDFLKPESFYKPSHQKIYKAMQGLFENQTPIDLLTVNEALSKSGEIDKIGGAAYLVDLTNKVASSANIEYHARILSQKYIQRELISLSTQTITDSFEDTKDVFTILDDAEQGLYDITQQNLKKGPEPIGTLAILAQKEMELIASKPSGLTGLPSGFHDLDKITNGWQPSDLIIIAARPGMGKTAFVVSLAINAAMLENKGIAFFSLEMANTQLAQRIIAVQSEVPMSNIKNADLSQYEWEKVRKAVEKLSTSPIYIDDTAQINIFEIRAKCRRLKMHHDIQMVVVDYLQLMQGSADGSKSTREQEISSISRALKGLAKELNIPVIALSQLSRDVEKRGGSKRPVLSDLRESGAIEQDADIVNFLYRPDYYETENPMEDIQGLTEVIIAKHRNGSTGTVNLRFIKEYTKFVNMDEFDLEKASGEMHSSPSGGGIQTIPSKMNIDQTGNEDDVPF